jgi:hypothetical protein
VRWLRGRSPFRRCTRSAPRRRCCRTSDTARAASAAEVRRFGVLVIVARLAEVELHFVLA